MVNLKSTRATTTNRTVVSGTATIIKHKCIITLISLGIFFIFFHDHASEAEEFKNIMETLQASSASSTVRSSGQDNGGNESDNSDKITYGVTVVHCKEQRMEWMKGIPKDWKLTVYETCRQNISYASLPFKNAGSEECTAYLSNIIDNYHDLPDINIFLQSDAFLDHGKKKKDYYTEHTPFWTFSELVNATRSWADSSHGKGYLAYGPDFQVVVKNINADNGYLIYYPREYFELMGLTYSTISDSDTRVEGRSGACFAVHKERIHNIPVEKYQSLKQSILQENGDLSRRKCCALENIWHVIFGEPYVIPIHSTVQHIWDLLRKRNKGLWPRAAVESG
mmetsp:Transcript_10551/g.19689  ORF Transcript_10551/g.19689 Transcript_10551/m.19689 type:complete len:337 (-) Transcript_10551:1924-2934(-)